MSLSQKLLYNIKVQKETNAIEGQLAAGSLQGLLSELDNDQKKIVFWVNIYNAFFQIIVDRNPTIFDHKECLFKGKYFTIAGEKISLDDVEHGLLRKSQFKYGLGFVRKSFVSSFEKKLRVKEVDPRIHFALNCGALSCPAIRFYSVENYNEDFDLAAKNFLDQTTSFYSDKNTVTVTSIFSWFRGDFGGIQGIKEMLLHFGYIPSLKVTLKFAKYNWTKDFKNFA